jgi:PAS domain-containing protein
MGYLSPEGTIVTTFHNPIFYELLGYSRAEYEALGIDYLSMLQEGDAKSLVSAMLTKQDFLLPLHVKQKDGTEITVQISVIFSPVDQVRKEFICYIFEHEREEPRPDSAQETDITKTSETGKRKPKTQQHHRQLKNSGHITLEW